MKHYLLTLLLAAICIPATAQIDNPKKPKMRRHHPGIDFIYMPQYAAGSNGGKSTLQYNRTGGSISYRFSLLPILRVGIFYENTAPTKVDKTVYDINDIYGFSLDFPIWIQNKVAIAPGISSNIRVPTNNKGINNIGSPISGGLYMNIMVRMTKSVALSAEFCSRKMPVYGYRQYPMRIGMKILL